MAQLSVNSKSRVRLILELAKTYMSYFYILFLWQLNRYFLKIRW